MKKVGSRELKNRLGKYLARVASGEVIIVTDRGRPVAQISRVHPASNETLDERLRVLEAAGILQRGTRPFRKRRLVPSRGKSASKMIAEDRR